MRETKKTPTGKGECGTKKRIFATVELVDGNERMVCKTYVSEKRAAALRRMMGF